MENIFYQFSSKDDGNIAFHTSNNKEQVIINQKNFCKKYDFSFKNLKIMGQTHSNNIEIVTQEKAVYKNCDGLITHFKDTPLMVMVADCIPILFFEPNKQIIAVAHAGRNGTYANIVLKIIEKMKNYYMVDPNNINVILGPSIQKCCYEVSEGLANIAKNSFGEDCIDGRFVDLQLINKKQLLNANILEKNISLDPTCTKCGNKPYFSYRKDKNCGRFCGVIEIKS